MSAARRPMVILCFCFQVVTDCVN